jgi:hypothetical protein
MYCSNWKCKVLFKSRKLMQTICFGFKTFLLVLHRPSLEELMKSEISHLTEFYKCRLLVTRESPASAWRNYSSVSRHAWSARAVFVITVRCWLQWLGPGNCVMHFLFLIFCLHQHHLCADMLLFKGLRYMALCLDCVDGGKALSIVTYQGGLSKLRDVD